MLQEHVVSIALALREVVVGSALIKPLCPSIPRQQRLLHSAAVSRESPRPSLSSLQIGVLSRMRDRPPLYETRHNYHTRTGCRGVDNPAMEADEQSAPGPPPPQRPVYSNTPPPPYDIEGRSAASPRSSVLGSEPPPYSLAIKESTSGVISDSSSRHSNCEQMVPPQPLAQERDLVNYKELYI